MADNRSRIESVRRELRAIAQFDAQKIHESSGFSASYNSQSSRAGARQHLVLTFRIWCHALTRCSARGAAHHVAQQEQ